MTKSSKKASLEQSLLAYRCISTDKTLTWKQNYVSEKFENDSLLKCTPDSIRKFGERLSFNITIKRNNRATGQSDSDICTGRDLINVIASPANQNIAKKDRRIIYSTGNGERPIGQNAFLLWNGFQVIDMDIHDRAKAEILKGEIFNDLKKYNWFLGIAFSSSGQGLHIYTKIQIPISDEKDERKKKILYFTNFRHKYSFVYICCKKLLDKVGATEDDLLKWMDLSMFRPQQGAFIPYDPDVLISTLFFEDFIYVCFDNVEDMGSPDVDWVSYPPLKQIFKRWEWFGGRYADDDEGEEGNNIVIKSAPELNLTEGVQKYHYKHNERWKLANTLVKLYGLEMGKKYMRLICTNDTTDKELEADCETANRHNKAEDPWAITRLNKYHGFKIKTNISDDNEDINGLYNTIDHIENPLMLRRAKDEKEYHITSKQYLSDIKDQLLADCNHITLIEAGAGVGKTEMVKSIAREGKRVMMVMPFTSTIKSKVEGDDLWYYAYGNRKPDFDKAQCLALTIDKFARLNLLELREAAFDYVFIDESHLLFQSEYRPVMPKVIDMISNSEIPIILMSGTPVGEIAFFPELTHLKVVKEDTRIKKFNVILTENDESMFLDMCRSMAKDISEGRRILFPTNKGSLYKEQVQAAIQYFCEEEFHCRYASRYPVVVNYYKKSNLGDDFMDNINKDKTVGKTDVLLCSNYLSVGVDINDKLAFSIYINDLWMPQEIEQFANRLRSNDLYVNLCIARNDAEGNPKPIFNCKDINLKLSDEELKSCKAILRLCNAMIERSPLEYKYNSLISSIIHSDKFIEYNEIENKYYLNETAYKTTMFERKYREFVEQLPVIIKGMQNYGYEFTGAVTRYKLDYMAGLSLESLCDKKKKAREELRLKNTEDIYDLINLITKDRLEVYRDAMRGKYEIKKSTQWKIDEEANVMWVKNIEVFEKVVPIFMSLSSMFEIEDIRSIFEYCKRGEHYNFSAIQRIKVLALMMHNDKNGRLDIPIKKFIEETGDFVDNHEYGCSRVAIDKFINQFALEYARSESTREIPIYLSVLTIEEMVARLKEIFKCLVDVGRTTKGNLCSLRRCELLWDEKVENIYCSADFDANAFLGVGAEMMMEDNTEVIDIDGDLPEEQENISIDQQNGYIIDNITLF